MKFDKSILEGITGITYDSREVKQGNIFICVKGETVDGHDFAKQAVGKGASLIVSQKELENIDCPHIVVSNTKQAMAELSALFYNNPSKELDLIGVTGTNGKTTVTHIIEKIFEKAGSKSALIGTLGTRASSADEYVETNHTTPQSNELQQSFREFVDKDVKKVVMEVSSHALEQHRVTECEFAGAVFTNLTQDHLDYHITMQNYFKAKAMLLDLLRKQSYAIINADDDYFKDLKHTLSYGINNKADVMAEDIEFSANGSEFFCRTPAGCRKVKLQLTGQFNIYNTLAAISVGIAEGIDLDTCIEAVESMPGVAGRFEVVSREPLVVVDYAHTPNGLENVLNAAKAIVPDDGNLVCVFGCGGDRDVTKRPQMGRIAEDVCDRVVITSDNPRTEDPQQIITDILTGIRELDSKKITVEIDRVIAIEQAILSASPKDVIVLAGKGHETYQILGTEKQHFDDREEARKAIQRVVK